jgi:hypothetical protein
LLVFEGCLGFLKAGAEKEWDRLSAQGRWSRAIDLWYINPLMERIIWDRSIKDDINIEVITYAGPDEWASCVSDLIGESQLPIRRVWAIRPEVLAHKIMSMPNVIRIYDPFKEHELYFGQRGRWIQDANQFARD